MKDATTLTPTSTLTPSTTNDKPTDTTVDPTTKPGDTKPGDKSPATGAPESYAFTPPEGQTYDQKAIDAATPIFKELNLTQAQADKLLTFYNTQMKDVADLGLKTRNAMIEKWNGEVKANPNLGPKLDTIKADLGRFKDIIFEGNTKLRTAFEEAVDLTGAGWHPAIIESLHLAAQKVLEGKSVSGGGPSAHGQRPNGVDSRPSAAASMYPNLPHA